MMWRDERPQHHLVRALPHLLDTVLLASGIYLAILLQINLADHPWLTAKIIGLVVYIVFASISYRPSASKPLQILFFVLALLVYAWIVSVAVSKQPAGFLMAFLS